MFNIQVTTIDPDVMNALSNFFAELAHHGAQRKVTGTIDAADSPDAGTDIIQQREQPTTTAAAVFGQTLPSILQPQANIFPDAAAVFGRTESPETATRAISREEIDAAIGRDAAAVFGGTLDPNLNSGAPSIAGAAASGTAHAGTTDISTSQTVAPPPAPPTGDAAGTVADPIPHTSPVLLDKNGLPWDVRIHAGTRTQTQKGEWKRKKGVDDATVAVVEAELRAALNAPAAAAKPFTPLNATAHEGEGVHAASAPHEKVSAPPPPPPAAAATVAPPPPPVDAVPSAAPTTFAELCKYVTGRAFKSEQILAVCNAHGLAGLGLVACRPDLIPSMYAQFSAL